MPSAKLHTTVDINASPDRVMDTFQDTASWPKWRSHMTMSGTPSLTSVRPGDRLNVAMAFPDGSKFNFTPKVLVNTRTELRWVGRYVHPWLFRGEHYFQAQPLGDKGEATRFVHGEEFSGVLVPLLGGMLTRTEVAFKDWNSKLKAAVEQGV